MKSNKFKNGLTYDEHLTVAELLNAMCNISLLIETKVFKSYSNKSDINKIATKAKNTLNELRSQLDDEFSKICDDKGEKIWKPAYYANYDIETFPNAF